MKKLIALLMTVFFIGSTAGFVMAESTGGAAKNLKRESHRDRKKKRKTTLNPQPLPPAKVPVDTSKTGAKTAN